MDKNNKFWTGYRNAVLPRDRGELKLMLWCPPAYAAYRVVEAIVDGHFPETPKPTTQVAKAPATDPDDFQDPMAAQ